MRNDDVAPQRMAEDGTSFSNAAGSGPARTAVTREASSPIDEALWSLLVIDDEPNILMALARVFHQESWRIFFASGAKETFDILNRHRVGVILCDQVMPGGDGTELLRATREVCPKAVHVMLTGSIELDPIIRAESRGEIFHVVAKPWDDDDLRQVIRNAFLRYCKDVGVDR